jgi:membrane-bound lytic murein transglycosylase C
MLSDCLVHWFDFKKQNGRCNGAGMPFGVTSAAIFFVLMLHVNPAASWVINDDPRSAQGESVQGPAPVKALAVGPAEAEVLSELAFERLERALDGAYRQHVSKIRPLWPDALTSDSLRWVTYSEDYHRRRSANFRGNNIDVTLFAVAGDSADFEQTQKVVTEELALVLGTTMAEALRLDPVLQVVESANMAVGEFGENLVFSELFTSPKPAEREINRLARRLMQRAEVGFYEQKASATVELPLKLSKRLIYTIPLPDDRLRKKAKQFRPHILQAAADLDVPVDLVFAIIHTESHFNPLARSPVPAYGLMQIVPRTAGRDATRLLYDQSKLLSPAYLYDPGKNIRVGAAYLRLLYFHYLKGIKDKKSRLYCAIAAYNAGVANVARVFGDVPAMYNAAEKINALSSQQVLAQLLESLPARETRDYLKKVLTRKSLYTRA